MPDLNNNKYNLLLWGNFVNGDHHSLSKLYFYYFDILLNFGFKYCTNICLIEDAIQNLFVDLLKNRKKLKTKKIQNVKFYLMRSLRNQILNELSKNKNMQLEPELGQYQFLITYSIENKLIAEENSVSTRKLLDFIKNQLTQNQKEILYLRYNCGFNYEEMAEILNINMQSARTLFYRSIKSIRKIIELKESSHLVENYIFRN